MATLVILPMEDDVPVSKIGVSISELLTRKSIENIIQSRPQETLEPYLDTNPVVLKLMVTICFSACQCNGQADSCDNKSGACFCRTRGVVGDNCDR